MAVHSISKDNAELSALVDEVQSGGEVVLVNKTGKPMAVLVAYNCAYPFAAGINEGVFKILPEDLLKSEPAKPARKPGSMAG
jgi:prevent-host-death family protein